MAKKLDPRVLAAAQGRRDAKIEFQRFLEWSLTKPANAFLFRGQEQNWALKPSIGRITKPKYHFENELRIIEEFKLKAIPYFTGSVDFSSWDWLALAQHHGLPTRLLDWSDNALVACYFACKPSPRGKKDGQITALRRSSVPLVDSKAKLTGSPFDVGEHCFLRPPNLAGRIISQRGSFSIHPSPNKAWQPRSDRSDFVVQAEMKDDFRRFLHFLGIDAAFLMNDLDGVSATLSWQYRNGLLA